MSYISVSRRLAGVLSLFARSLRRSHPELPGGKEILEVVNSRERQAVALVSWPSEVVQDRDSLAIRPPARGFQVEEVFFLTLELQEDEKSRLWAARP